MTNEQQNLVDDSSPVKFFSQSPHIDHDDCDADEFYLLHHYKKVIGLNNGQPCVETIAETMERVGWGEAKTREVRSSLVTKGLIRIDTQDGYASAVTLINRWRENFERYDTRIENRYPSRKPIRGLGENRDGSEEKKSRKELKNLNTFTNPPKSGSSQAVAKTPKRGTQKTKKATDPYHTDAEKDAIYDTIRFDFMQLNRDDPQELKLNAAMVGKWRKILFEMNPSISVRRATQFCKWLGGLSSTMKNLKDSASFQSYYARFEKEHPPKEWVEGKIYDDPEYRELKRPPYRKLQAGQWYMSPSWNNPAAWIPDPSPIVD